MKCNQAKKLKINNNNENFNQIFIQNYNFMLHKFIFYIIK